MFRIIVSTLLFFATATASQAGRQAPITQYLRGLFQTCTYENLHSLPTDPERKFLCVQTDSLTNQGCNFSHLRNQVVALAGAHFDSGIVQVIGDSNQFTPEGTKVAEEFLHPFLQGDRIIEYGLTGHRTDKTGAMDVNSIVSKWLEENPDQRNRVVANVVGHSVIALERWGCWAPELVRNFVCVVNGNGLETDSFTKFGDDVLASDKIMKQGDLVVVLEGGAQSFLQVVNTLEQGVAVRALTGIRSEENKRFFSTAEFLQLVLEQEKKEEAPLTPDAVQKILEEYLQTHQAWNPNRPDAATKAPLFWNAAQRFCYNLPNLSKQVKVTNFKHEDRG